MVVNLLSRIDFKASLFGCNFMFNTINLKVLFLYLSLFCLMLIYFPKSGGVGVALPWNLLFIGWVGIAVIMLARHKKVTFAHVDRQPLLTIGGILLSLPWLIQARDNPGVWALLVGLFLWWILLRITINHDNKKIILLGIFGLSLSQSLICLIQAFLPHAASQLYQFDWLFNHGRPYGIFQQINLLASFLATGMGCGVLLLTQEIRWRWCIAYALGLGLLAFVLAINQSRAGAIGAGLITVLLSLIHWRMRWQRIVAALTIIAIFAFAGWYITHHIQIVINGVPYALARDYAASTHERWKILAITWQMIMQKPWGGWGYGTFEYAFSRYVLSHPECNYTYSSIITHPHNELLYAWFQGGIVALAGLVLLFCGWVSIIFHAGKRGLLAISYALLIIPLLVHLNLEYPFYQSLIHFGLFIVLLRLGCNENSNPVKTAPLTPRLTLITGSLLVGFSMVGFCTANQLTGYERNGMLDFPNPAPWYFFTQFDRAKFDAMVALLIDFNQTHNQADLEKFMTQAEDWSSRHNDYKVWLNMMMIARYNGEQKKLAVMEREYPRLFPLQTQWKTK